MDKFDSDGCEKFVRNQFYDSVVPSLSKFIQIDNLSRSYDENWATNGKLKQAADHLKNWVDGVGVTGLKSQVITDEGYSPLLFIQIPGTVDKTILFYGHFDKQPHFEGWEEGLGPVTPVIKNGKLYGRGGADDGYATYSTILAIRAVQEQGIALPRCVMIAEGDEESGSGHMTHYLPSLKERIGNPEIVFCLDSGTMDYDRFWLTKSLRGNLVATLRVENLSEGVHSGTSSGVIPSCVRIAQMLLNRIENIELGKFNEKFMVNIPADRYEETYRLYQLKGKEAVMEFPFLQGSKPVSQNPMESLLNRSWRPTLTITGQNGLSPTDIAGNVMLPFVQFKFSLRMPPTLDSNQAVTDLIDILTTNVPFGAKATVKNYRAGKGWNAPVYDKYLQDLIDQASLKYFKNERLSIGEGGSIPLMGKLLDTWPNAQFIITGVLGPASNAHGPNESLDLEFTKNLTCSIAHVLGGISQHAKS